MSSEPAFTLDRWLAGECKLGGDARRARCTPLQLWALCELAGALLPRVNPALAATLELPATAHPRAPRGEGLTAQPLVDDLTDVTRSQTRSPDGAPDRPSAVGAFYTTAGQQGGL